MMSNWHHYLYHAILFILINIKVLAFSYQFPPLSILWQLMAAHSLCA